jgi:hypothetical protein
VAQHLIATGDSVAYDYPMGVKVNAFRAVDTAPLAVEEAPLAGGCRLEPAAPNPFARSTRIRFSLPAEATTRVEVFDCAGRLVQLIAAKRLAAGAHSLVWDGRDREGRPVSSGIYLVRLRSGGEILQRKVVRLDR